MVRERSHLPFVPRVDLLCRDPDQACCPRLEHVFAHQKNRYGLFIRTVGIARAQAKLTLANLTYNFDRLIFHERCAATG